MGPWSLHGAHWASWADCFSMIQERHSEITAKLFESLESNNDEIETIYHLRSCCLTLMNAGMELPSWTDLRNGLRAPKIDVVDEEPGVV